MVTTSFWASFPNKEFWSNPPYADVDYADLHAYISTGWGLTSSFLSRACWRPARRMCIPEGFGEDSGDAGVEHVDGAARAGDRRARGMGDQVLDEGGRPDRHLPVRRRRSMLRIRWQLDGGPY